MGWAKYFEDDVSIYIGRMHLRSVSIKLPQKLVDSKSKPRIYHSKPRPAYSAETNKRNDAHTIDKTDRHGIELSFSQGLDKSTERRLRLNHWWHKQNTNTWYNNNTQANRKFAEQFVVLGLAEVSTVRRRGE